MHTNFFQAQHYLTFKKAGLFFTINQKNHKKPKAFRGFRLKYNKIYIYNRLLLKNEPGG